MKSQVFAFLFPWVVLVAQSMEPDGKPGSHAQRGFTVASIQSPPTLEQQKMDVTYYGLELDIRPDSKFFAGSLQIRANIEDTSITHLEFDLRNESYLLVASATLNGGSVAFDHSGNLIRIALPAAGPKPTSVEVHIDYTYGPVSATNYRPFNFDSHLGQDLIWTMSQPYDARAWWPCKDYPADKPDSMDMRVTVPGNMTVVSNGRLVSIQDGEDGRKTFHWHEGYPIATYLVSLAIYPYFIWGDEYVSAAGDTMPIEFYTFTDPDSPEPWYLTSNYLKTKDMLYTFVDLFGEYPFLDEKYGHAEWGLSYGMEHQTITSMGNPTERRVAHELAHQWWGDMITCATYQHMWLNEGFATYAEALWFESTGGTAAYRDKMNSLAYYGSGTIYIDVPTNSNVFRPGICQRRLGAPHVEARGWGFNVLSNPANLRRQPPI